MADAGERIVNLALYLAAARRPVTAEQIRTDVGGYGEDQEPAAFARMFERDKDELRRAGLVIAVDSSEGTEAYRLDADATYSGRLELDRREVVELRAAGAAALGDPSFPFRADLRYALAKVVAASDTPDLPVAPPAGALSADEDPEAQGAAAAVLAIAVTNRKRVTFSYTGVGGKRSERTVEPWGLFARDGRWYLVARDPEVDAPRVFAVARVEGLTVEEARPKTPDFERPADFDVNRWMLAPFQYGPHRTEGVVRLSGPAAARAEALAAGQGALEPQEDGTVLWRVGVADPQLFARWAADAAPGVAILEPSEARQALLAGLRKAVEAHA